MKKFNLKKCKSSNKGITLIALIITIIVLLILAGVTIAQLTGSDSAPVKANEAKQKNDIGAAKDDVSLTATNALTEAYETAYVADGVSAGDASTTVGTLVRTKLNQKYGTDGSFTTGLATITATASGTITIWTTDFEITGEIAEKGGQLTWGEVLPNVPSITLTAQGSNKVAPGGTLQLGANFRKMDSIALGSLTWTSSNTNIATVNTSGLVTVDSEAQDGQTVNITATGNGVTSSPFTITVQDLPSVSKYKTQASTNGVTALSTTENVTIYDDNNRPVIIPMNFGIAVDSGTKIEEGIVIEDASKNANGTNTVRTGNQFVWVPVDTTVTYNSNYVGSDQQKSLATANSALETDGATTGTIKLSRYDFGSKALRSQSTLVPKGLRDEVEQAFMPSGKYYFTEDKLRGTETTGFSVGRNSYKASVARDIDEFISKTNIAKGFYIGRYEMGKESSTDSTAVCKLNRTTYTNIVRGDVTVSGDTVTTTGAVQQSRDMYGYIDGKYASDLINSYAWDTAIAFIEKCGTNSNYAFQIKTRTTKTSTGSTIYKDEKCKIFDMAGNVYEWITERSNVTDKPCSFRGGMCNADNFYASFRSFNMDEYGDAAIGFRPILYIL